jgi:predicted nucleic acid-binding protein
MSWLIWTIGAASGPTLVVDASCLFEVAADSPRAPEIAARLAAEPDQAAPEVVDVEVLGVIRAQFMRGGLDGTAARQAVADLRDWPGERHSHRWMLDRVWQLRDSVRGWDAFYVTLAEALDATLVTLDGRLARAHGPMCRIEVLGGPS